MAEMVDHLPSPSLRQPEEQAVSISLLRIFNRSIRKMPKTSLSFAQSLEKKVLPLINGAMGGYMVRAADPRALSLQDTNCSMRQSVQGLQESIACLCVIIDHLTQNYERLVRLLGSCTSASPGGPLVTLRCPD